MDELWLQREFGDRLKQLRGGARLTQESLAEAADLSRTSIVNIEAGRQGVSLATIYRLADAIGVAPEALLPALPARDLPQITLGVEDADATFAVQRILQRAQEATQ